MAEDLLAVQATAQESGSIYNVGTGTQTTLREVVEVARRLLGIVQEPEWESMPSRDWDSPIWVADNRKLKAHLNWRISCSFEQGFHQMLEWLIEHPDLRDYYYNALSCP